MKDNEKKPKRQTKKPANDNPLYEIADRLWQACKDVDDDALHRISRRELPTKLAELRTKSARNHA